MNLKNTIRATLIFLHLDLTKNLEYDRLTKKILKQVLKQNSNCVDVGCHKGEILDEIIALAPNGKHFAFEPLPHLYQTLKHKYSGKATIYPFALSDKSGSTTFNFVKNAPAYSGINKRKYDTATPDIEEITVELNTIDAVLLNQKIDLIKIDVEGGEFGVLKGAAALLKRDLPVVIFESGMGASDFYGTQPKDLYQFLNGDIGLKISTLKGFLNKDKALDLHAFEHCFNTNTEYYFIAHQ